MAAAKKKRKIQASEIVVGKRVEAVLIDLAERARVNEARHAEFMAQHEERMAQIEERPARTDARPAWSDEWTAWLGERSARVAEQWARDDESMAVTFQTIVETRREIHAILQKSRPSNSHTEGRRDAQEGRGGLAWGLLGGPCPHPPHGVGCLGTMAAAKKSKIQASEIEVGNRTLLGVLIDLAEQAKENAARSVQAQERSVRAEELAAEAAARSARAEEGTERALKTIAAVHLDLQAITLELRTANRHTEARLAALERPVGA